MLGSILCCDKPNMPKNQFLGPKLFVRAESQLLGWVSHKVQVNLSCPLGLVIYVLCPVQWA